MRIIGFFHICAINHYKLIVAEQMNLLLTSGLYEACENIFVGVVGEDEGWVEDFFHEYKKIKVLSKTADLTKFEFATLKILHDKSKSEKSFYGFYLHTKGVSYPDAPHREGGDYWRDYMNHFNLTRWQENVNKLDEGFETCGVKFIDKGFPPHYSGNFFWFKSDYAKKLAPITKLNSKDRYIAEMWLCSNYPKVACLCDLFVDYKTRGKFNPDNLTAVAREVKIEKPKEVRDTHPKEYADASNKAVVQLLSGSSWSSILNNFDKTPEVIKIIEKLDTMEVITKEVVEDFVRCKRKNPQEIFETIGMLFRNHSTYNPK